MKITECKECKSKDLLITSDLNGQLFAATCRVCGWDWESPEFKTLAQEMDDIINGFDRKDLLKTKKKLI